jgi:hypothetical protein
MGLGKMVKIDLSKVNYTGKEQKEQEVDDPLAVQRMRLEEAKWRALGGAGGDSDNDPIDREVSKALRDLRIKSTMRELRSSDDAAPQSNSALKNLEDELRRTREELQEMKRQKEQAEQDAKWQKQFDDLKSMILMQNQNTAGKKEEITPWQQKLQDQLEMMQKEREKEREERRKEMAERESEERKKELEALKSDIEDRYATIEAMLRESGGSKNRGIIAEAQRISEEQAAMKQIAKSMGLVPSTGQQEEKMSVDEIISSITSNSDKLLKTGTSIYNSIKKGGDEYEYDIGPREKMPEFAVEPKTSQSAQPNEAEAYVKEGKEITNHPDFPGKPVWVGKYGDFYLSDDNTTPLDRKAMELVARTRKEEMLENIESARKAYMDIMKEQQEKVSASMAAPEHGTAPLATPGSGGDEDNIDSEYDTQEEAQEPPPAKPEPETDGERRQKNLENLAKAREAKKKKAEQEE